MKIRELTASLQTMDPEREASVALFKLDGTGEAFETEAVGSNDGDAQLEIYEGELDAEVEEPA
jgi:hypothetical protein